MKKGAPLFLLLLILTLLSLTFSCRKDPSKIGLEINPESDNLDLGIDTMIFFASYTVEYDSMTTSNSSGLLLGSINDPIFGTTQASFFTQLRLEKNNPNFGTNATLDSVCLQLGYLGRWGDSTTMMTANVYLLEEAFEDSTTYYADSELRYIKDTIGQLTFLENIKDSVTVVTSQDTTTYPPFLSIRLNDTFGKKLLESVSDFSTNESFLEKFPGIHVAVEPVQGDFGKVLYFSPTSSLSKIVLYYSNTDAKTSFSFPINSSCIRFNKYDLDHSNAASEFAKQLNATEPTPDLGNERLYLQPLSGARVRVNLEGIERLREMENIVLNEVALELFVDGYDEHLPPPSQLSLLTYSEGKTNWLIDANPYSNPSGYFDGKFNESKKGYRMRITRYIQQLLLDETVGETDVYLEIDGSALVANRAVLFGNNPSDSEKRARIRVVYTVY